MLEAEWDNWFLAKATAYGRKIFETQAFQEIVVSEEVFPGCEFLDEEVCKLTFV